MSKKDTILVAVIINAGLLAILFATAIIYDTDKLADDTLLESTALAEAPFPPSYEQNPVLIAHNPALDEMDAILKQQADPLVPLALEEFYLQDNEVPESSKAQPIPPPRTDYVEVIVKKGDSLDKIAKVNGSSISAIKKANHLTSERLSIGQVLKVPLNKEEPSSILGSTPPTPPTPVKQSVSSEGPVYHTVKSGDSPWKIAKQYGVKYEDILKLNHLDEEKARNLKIGDQLRVK